MQFRSTKATELRRPAEQWADACLRVVDGGIAAILFAAPLVFSGRHDLGRLVFVAIVAATATAWFARQAILGRGRLVGTAAYGVLAAAVALVAVQLVPLPAEWVARLSPRNAELLPLWSGGEQTIGAWRTLSLSPESTRVALAMLGGYALLFVTVVQRLEKLEHVERLVRWIAGAAVAAAGLALVQYFAGNGQYFGFYRVPYYEAGGDVVGSFLNKNHLAHFVILGTAPLLALLIERLPAPDAPAERSSARTSRAAKAPPAINPGAALAAAGLAAAAFTVLLTLSRGGAISLAASGAVALGYYWRRGTIDGRRAAMLAVPALAVVALLGAYGYDRVATRLDDLAGGSLDAVDTQHNRRQIWAANVAAIRDGGLFGAGAGSHAEIYPAYLDAPTAKWFTYAENGYLQIVTENGPAGGLLLAIAAGMIVRWCVVAMRRSRTAQAQLLAGAVAAGLAASFVHSLVDFVWYVPACMSATVLLAACALRLAQLADGPIQPQHSWSLGACRVAFAGTAMASLALVAPLVGPGRAALSWDRYQLASIAQAEAAGQALRTPGGESAAELEAADAVRVEAMAMHLEHVVRVRPRCARAHQRLSKCYMQIFERRQQESDNAMPIAQICDAAMASQFASAAELRQWLGQAFGGQSALLFKAYAHARRAVELAPLIPDSYLQLAKLSFLEGRPSEFAVNCVDQALALGPYDGGVLYESGVELGILGQWERANACWKLAYQAGSLYQLHIIQSAPGRIPVAAFLGALQPGWDSLRAVWAYYSAAASPEELALLADYAQRAAAEELSELSAAEQSRTWLALGMMQRDLNRSEAATASLERAVAVEPNHYNARRMLGMTLVEASRFGDAEPHLRWCLSRRPDDRGVSDALAASLRGQSWATAPLPPSTPRTATAPSDTTIR